ncbi:hypothetical protein MSAS_12370 [Mycobacterium saskatchewanense]|uniref:Uncharacterized protein n=1 Tax=Mycobacterium saskatchewanense TaxID=220927 RepID=A0AAJ3NT77_9MYCO|nr:hypothetical protein [Mycobacterium saskatchewanense]ORW73493.1 hypothetical protein AWC23_06895 [Mycobacterium saskatchewanense]BBX62063.1 hypothetical protein MSAS_12370 [Mycobacterium saskatchewanense]
MTVQDDKTAGHDDERKSAEGEEDQDERAATEKPEPDEDDKKAAAEMMEAYKEKPTIVLPGSSGMVSGTAVNEWLDDDGNPKFEVPEDADSDLKSKAEEMQNDEEHKKRIEEDKALNDKLREAAAEENKGEKS